MADGTDRLTDCTGYLAAYVGPTVPVLLQVMAAEHPETLPTPTEHSAHGTAQAQQPSLERGYQSFTDLPTWSIPSGRTGECREVSTRSFLAGITKTRGFLEHLPQLPAASLSPAGSPVKSAGHLTNPSLSLWLEGRRKDVVASDCFCSDCCLRLTLKVVAVSAVATWACNVPQP